MQQTHYVRQSHYVGIDIGKANHAVGILTEESGQIVGKETFEISNTAPGMKILIDRLKALNPIRVGMEATGHYWLVPYEQLTKNGFKSITVFNPLQTKAYRNEGIRGSKTDKIDSLLIAKILRLGEETKTTLPDEKILGLRVLARFCCDLVEKAAAFKRRLWTVIEITFPEYEEIMKSKYGKGSLALLSKAATAHEIAHLDTETMIEILSKASRGHFGRDKAEEIREAAANSVGLSQALDAFSLQAKILISQIQHLENQIDVLGKELENRLGDHVITSIPGIGSYLGALIVGEIGDIKKYISKDGAKQLVALAGLDPRLKSSGKYNGQVKMSKRGSKYLRWALTYASSIAVQHDPYFKDIFTEQQEKGKPYRVCLSHVARELTHVVYALLRDNRKYDPDWEEKMMKKKAKIRS